MRTKPIRNGEVFKIYLYRTVDIRHCKSVDIVDMHQCSTVDIYQCRSVDTVLKEY